MSRSQSLWGALLFLLFGLLFWRWEARAAAADQALMVRRIVTPVLKAVQKAHREHDDLAIEEAVQNLASGPGVTYAAVVDGGHRVIAHSDPSCIGKGFEAGRSRPIVFDLKNEEGSWGKLYYALSDRSRLASRRTRRFCFGAGLLTLWLVHWILERRSTEAVSRMASDHRHLQSLIQDAEGKRQRSEEEAIQLAEAARSWLREALALTGEALLFLDHSHQVVAVSRSFARLMKGTVRDFEGKRWHEIPRLAEQGLLFEESLSLPGKKLALDGSEGRLMLWTLPDRSGTWLRFE